MCIRDSYKLTEEHGEVTYKPGKLSDAKRGAKVRLYDVTNDKQDNADIIVVDDRE